MADSAVTISDRCIDGAVRHSHQWRDGSSVEERVLRERDAAIVGLAN